MFHVEHRIRDFFQEYHKPIPLQTLTLLVEYTHAVHSTNDKFNITGFSSIEDITEKLILDSIRPLLSLNVPRGTQFLDMGTGAGIPGIPLCLVCDSLSGTLVDSNHKKIAFLEDIIRGLRIQNATPVCIRGEEMAKDSAYRDSFFFAISRAFSNVYTMAEICAPMIEIGGFLYIYSKDALPDISQIVGLQLHFSDLGIRPATAEERACLGLGEENIILKKIADTPLRYPRRYAAIKREAQKILGHHIQ